MSNPTASRSTSMVDAAQLAKRVRAKRQAEQLSLRAAAKKLGVSAATISRVESGRHLPGRDHLLRLAEWAGVPIGSTAQRQAHEDPVHGHNASTVEAVELHLRADEQLDPEDAEIIVRLVRTAYDQMANKRRK